jgi:hypothetical protein
MAMYALFQFPSAVQLLRLLFPFPKLTLGHLAPGILLNRACNPSSHTVAARMSRIGRLQLSLAKRSRIFNRFRPQNLLLAVPVQAVLEEMLPCLGPVRAPPTHGCGPAPRPRQGVATKTITGLQLVESRRQRLLLFAGARSGFWSAFCFRQCRYFC